MIKKIGIKDLQPGMFVHEYNCGHIFHPLLRMRFKVSCEQEVENLIQRGVSSVYIDTHLGGDVRDAPTAEEVRREIEISLQKMAALNTDQYNHDEQMFISQEELQFAHHVHDETMLTVHKLMAETRLGKSAALEQVYPIAQHIVESIFRNAAPLLQINNMRNKDDYLFYHSVASCALVCAFAHRLKIGQDVTRQIAIGAMLHDIGKTRVAESILNKPGCLTESEFDEMKQHVAYGMEILREEAALMPVSLQVVAHHHERYDGSGYPAGLKGPQISQAGQMAAIVDVYDAITSERTYHKAMEPVEAIRKLREWGEQFFNIELVDHFICCVGIYPVGTLVRLESGLLGVVSKHNPANLISPFIWVIYDSNKRQKIQPYEFNLAGQFMDRIIGYESAKKWGGDLTEVIN